MLSLLMTSLIQVERCVKQQKFSNKKELSQYPALLLMAYFLVIIISSLGKALQNIQTSQLDQVIVTNSIPGKEGE